MLSFDGNWFIVSSMKKTNEKLVKLIKAHRAALAAKPVKFTFGKASYLKYGF